MDVDTDRRISVSSPVVASGDRRSVAIISFIPDLGHVQPLLKIADALAGRG